MAFVMFFGVKLSAYVLKHGHSKPADQKLLHMHELLEVSDVSFGLLCKESVNICFVYAYFSLLSLLQHSMP